jgi:O-antigen/teichoic acid export membrane protein
MKKINFFSSREFNNSAWLLVEKGFTLSLSFLVGVITARYLGPSDFGNFSYCLSVIGVLSGISMLGLDRLIIRDLAEAKEKGSSIIATHQLLKFIGALIVGVLAFLIVYIGPNANKISLVVITFLAFANIFASFYAVEIFFLSELQTKNIVPIRVFVLIFSAISRILVVVLGGGIVHLSFIALLEAVCLGFLLVLKYKKVAGVIPFTNLKLDYALKLVREGWPLFLGLQLDIFIQKIYGVALNGQMSHAEYGQFMLALRLIEIPLMLLYLSSTSYLPRLTILRNSEVDKFENKILYYTEIGTIIGISSWIFVALFGTQLTIWVFGEDYKDTASALNLLWGAVFFQANALFRAHFLTIESSQITLLLGNFSSLVIAIPASLMMIKYFGWHYAGLAFSFSSFAMYFLSGFLTDKGRRIMRIQIKALTFPNLRNFIRII